LFYFCGQFQGEKNILQSDIGGVEGRKTCLLAPEGNINDLCFAFLRVKIKAYIP